jgi:hypothetical protein
MKKFIFLLLVLHTGHAYANNFSDSTSLIREGVGTDKKIFNYYFGGGTLTLKTYWIKFSLTRISFTHKDWGFGLGGGIYFIDIKRVSGLENISNDLDGGVNINSIILNKLNDNLFIFGEIEIDFIGSSNVGLGSGLAFLSSDRFITKVGLYQHIDPKDKWGKYKYDTGIQMQFGLHF